MSATLGAKGYTTPRPFGGFRIPIGLQSAAIRRYCDEHSFAFYHHSSENLTGDSFAVLSAIVEGSDRLDAIVMCSTSMLPRDTVLRTQLLRRANDHGCAIHFIFENLIVADAGDVQELEVLLGLVALAELGAERRRYIADLAGIV